MWLGCYDSHTYRCYCCVASRQHLCASVRHVYRSCAPTQLVLKLRFLRNLFSLAWPATSGQHVGWFYVGILGLWLCELFFICVLTIRKKHEFRRVQPPEYMLIFTADVFHLKKKQNNLLLLM